MWQAHHTFCEKEKVSVEATLFSLSGCALLQAVQQGGEYSRIDKFTLQLIAY
jgi:hypothetical protein